MRRILMMATLVVLVFGSGATCCLASTGNYPYLTPSEVNTSVDKIAGQFKNGAVVKNLATTPGGRKLMMLELGGKGSELPAILVVANPVGDYPIATEAALNLAQLLTGDWKEELDKHRWYIVPVGNPDGYARFFEKPRFANPINDRSFNDDKDDATDEDGPEDLNGDGYITQMRQKNPDGKWVAVADNPVLLKRADNGKGEQGMYRLFTEGIDNDGDGEYNEDGRGGAIPGHNFPHDFQHYTKHDGLWAASEPETRGILEFAFAHPEIAMVIVLDRTNSLQNVPEGNKRAAVQDKYKLPDWMARRSGLDPDREYPIKELVEIARDLFDDPSIDEDRVAQFLDGGAAVNPDRNDLPYWTEISKRYNDFIKEGGSEEKHLKPEEFSSGSVQEWAYFQFGVPTFTMNFWTLPEPKKEEKVEEGGLSPDSLEKMSNEDFIALGPDRINEILKASGAPSMYTADMVIKGLEGGMFTTKKMAEMMRKMKKKEEGGGADEAEEALYAMNPQAFVSWQEYDHPTLGKVEIGGMIPYSTVLPPDDMVRPLIEGHLPFLRQLAQMLPAVRIGKVEVEKIAGDVWKLTLWAVNDGFLPYPTYQGKRCQRPIPAVLTISGKGINVLEGRERTALELIEGSGGSQKLEWLINAPEGTTLDVQIGGPSIGKDMREVSLKGGSR